VAQAVVSALLLALAFPPLGVWALAWAALIPLYAALSTPSSPRRLAAVGFVFGLSLFLGGMFWMNEIGALPWAVLAMMQGTFFALFGLVAGTLLPRLPPSVRPLVFAAAWTLFEWARSLGRMAFPWFLLASSQTRPDALPLLQVVALTAQWGLSFAIAATNGYLAEALRARRLAAALLGAAIPALLYGFGRLAMAGAHPAATVPVAVVQGCENRGDRGDVLGLYSGLTRRAAPAHPAFVLWPETTVRASGTTNEALYRLAQETGATLVSGIGDEDSDGAPRNTVRAYSPDGRPQPVYDKRRLVPFGEFFPGRPVLGGIFARYGVDYPDFVPGDAAGIVIAGPLRLGTLICYESAFPWIARDCVRQGAEALTIPTSDQTFGTSAGPYQHFDMAVVRAVETRRYVVRAASTGISAIIAPDGRVQASLPIGRRDLLTGTIRPSHERSLAVRAGDWWIGACIILALGSYAAVQRNQWYERDVES
jgi:apolipoprotein N-acyltransferase